MTELPDWTTNINIGSQTLAAVNVDIVAMTVGTIAVDIVAQTVGNIAIDIAAQTVGNVAISIAAQVVDLNIKTSGGVNIVIDQLTQTAYTERRTTLTNGIAPDTWAAYTGNTRAGKFFPRGCRGFIFNIGVYCRDTAAAGGTVTVYIAPFIGAGALYMENIVVPAGGGPALRYAAFNIMWEYDSMFIWVVCSNAQTEIGYDSNTPYDAFTSTDIGATWAYLNFRYAFVATMKAMTVGDIPVSGTINTIEIPNVATVYIEGPANLVVLGNIYPLVDFYGMGYTDLMEFSVTANPSAEFTWFRIYCDERLVYEFMFQELNARGYTAGTPGVSLLAYAADGVCVALITKRFDYRQRFRVDARNLVAVPQWATLRIHPSVML